MALPNDWSDRSATTAWITSSSSARPIYAESCDPTRATTMTSDRTGHWTKMHRSLARFSGPGASNPCRSWADSITITSGFEFSVHTADRGTAWSWEIDTVIPVRSLRPKAKAATAGTALRRFRAAWDRFAADEANLVEFLNAKR